MHPTSKVHKAKYMLHLEVMYGAIDIGGTKTLVAVFDNNGKVTEQVKFPTPKDYDEFSSELAATVARLSTKAFEQFCVAAPGRIDREHGIGIRFGNLGWENVPILHDIEKVLKTPGIIENDAKAAGLSEAIELDGKYRKVLYITISTGIGCGYIINEKIDPDFQDIEVGHMLLEHGDHLARWENFASGSAIVKKFGKRASEIDATDTDAWYIIARNIAVGLIDVIATLNPDIIILGGGVSTHFPKFQDRLNEQMKIYENPMLTIPPIIQAKRTEEAVIYGCYELAKEAHKNTHGKVAHKA